MPVSSRVGNASGRGIRARLTLVGSSYFGDSEVLSTSTCVVWWALAPPVRFARNDLRNPTRRDGKAFLLLSQRPRLIVLV